MLPATTNYSSLPSPSPSPVGGGPLMMDPRWKTNIEIAPNCPRCASTNTKFCYYNNYSLSQPRYFCKSCRRYWTKGGSLRNVPFGGGCRKNRRPKSSRTALPSHQQDGSDPPLNNNTSLPTSSNSSSSSSDIDLALVFSNFLNSDPGLPLPVDDPSSLNSSDSFMQENVMDFIPDIELMEGLHHQDVFVSGSNDTGNIIYQQEERILQPPPALENVDLDPNGYGLQGLLSDEELLWSETNFSWQQMQVQSTWEQLPDDHAMFHQNSLLQGNWNSFDIPSYGT